MSNNTESLARELNINAVRSTLNIRIKPEDKNLIDRAATAVGKNRSEFVLDAVCRAAEETLADLRVIKVSSEVYEQFIAQLDMPPQSNDALKKTMQAKAPWEK